MHIKTKSYVDKIIEKSLELDRFCESLPCPNGEYLVIGFSTASGRDPLVTVHFKSQELPTVSVVACTDLEATNFLCGGLKDAQKLLNYATH